MVCEQCHAERLVAFSCKQRGFCPSCGARRMAESARHLTPAERRRSMTWTQRLKRVFGIGVTTRTRCGGAVRIVAGIEEPNAIRAILAHFQKHDALDEAHYRPAPRAPPAVAV